MKKVLAIVLSTFGIVVCVAAVFFAIHFGKVSAQMVTLQKKSQEKSVHQNEWVSERGQSYYYNDEGRKSSGLTVIEDETYYFDDKLNYMKKGWINKDGESYYFKDDGSQVFGACEVDGKTCWFDEKTGAFKRLSVDPSKPMVAVTYDDGPSSVTGRILDILERNGAKATFFQIGNQVSSYPEAEKRIVALGCELANHTWSHKWLSSLSIEDMNYQIDHTSDTVESIAGVRPHVMRPPGGIYNKIVQAEADMPMIYWSIDTLDWKTRDATQTISAVLDHVRDGDIILMHDLYEQTAVASETIIPELIKRGYQLVTISELAQARGIAMENGKVYFNFYK